MAHTLSSLLLAVYLRSPTQRNSKKTGGERAPSCGRRGGKPNIVAVPNSTESQVRAFFCEGARKYLTHTHTSNWLLRQRLNIATFSNTAECEHQTRLSLQDTGENTLAILRRACAKKTAPWMFFSALQQQNCFSAFAYLRLPSIHPTTHAPSSLEAKVGICAVVEQLSHDLDESALAADRQRSQLLTPTLL